MDGRLGEKPKVVTSSIHSATSSFIICPFFWIFKGAKLSKKHILASIGDFANDCKSAPEGGPAKKL
jgi:hypothetical protein